MERDLRWQVGQKLAVGFPGTEVPQALRELVAEYKIGNIILFEENIRDAAQLRRLCGELRTLIATHTGLPPLISIDQEGGVVSRLKGDCALAPSAMGVAATGDPVNAHRAGEITGRELRALGVNFDLAPVMDVNSNPRNPVIGARSYGARPEDVCDYGTAMIRGLQAGGVRCCAKHFPGHGDTAVDSHLGLPRVDKTLQQLEACELIPFRAAIRSGVDAIMTTHILFPRLEPGGVPATMSRRILTGMLREQLGFRGLIVSDCMMMGAIQDDYGTVPGCLAAAKAGVDLLFVSHSMELAAQVARALAEEAAAGRLDAGELAASVARMVRLREHLPPAEGFEAVGSAAHRDAFRAMRRAGLTRVGTAPRPELGENPLFLGCYPFRTTQASSPVDTKVAFGPWMAQRLGGEALVTPTDPEEGDIARAVDAARGHSALVLGTYNAHVKRGQLRLLAALAGLGLPMACVALRDPYDLAGLPENVYGLAAYEYNIESLDTVAQALTGAFTPVGRLPVPLEGGQP